MLGFADILRKWVVSVPNAVTMGSELCNSTFVVRQIWVVLEWDRARMRLVQGRMDP